MEIQLDKKINSSFIVIYYGYRGRQRCQRIDGYMPISVTRGLIADRSTCVRFTLLHNYFSANPSDRRSKGKQCAPCCTNTATLISISMDGTSTTGLFSFPTQNYHTSIQCTTAFHLIVCRRGIYTEIKMQWRGRYISRYKSSHRLAFEKSQPLSLIQSLVL